MVPQIINRIAPSFIYFLDHKMLKNGQAFVNVDSGHLSFKEDPSFPNKTIFASQYRQFVSDYSIQGANIPSGVYINNNFIGKNVSGLKIDYEMGRIMFDDNVSKNINNIKCSYAFKEYNIYYNESQDEEIIFDAKYQVKPSNINGQNPSLEYSQIVYPAIFVKSQYNEHVPFAFGGEKELQMDLRAIYLADSQYLLDAGMSIASELVHKYFPVLYPKDMPFNVFGDYKSYNFNYLNLCSAYSQTGSLMAMINSVKISKFSSKTNNIVGNGIYGGFADFSIKYMAGVTS
jgi:hypothetical protein